MKELNDIHLTPEGAKMFPTLRRASHADGEPIRLYYGDISNIGTPPEHPDYITENKITLRQCFPVFGVYQVGLLEGFETGDPTYYTLEGAETLASKLSIKQHAEIYPAAYAVWDNDTGGICAIYYLGECFT